MSFAKDIEPMREARERHRKAVLGSRASQAEAERLARYASGQRERVESDPHIPREDKAFYKNLHGVAVNKLFWANLFAVSPESSFTRRASYRVEITEGIKFRIPLPPLIVNSRVR